MSALLPCPFCGGTEGRFHTDAHSDAYTGKWGWWECGCGACGEDVRTSYDDGSGWKADAIAAWNRRHVPPGFVLVPVEPTPNMAKEGTRAQMRDNGVADIYRAMLAAAKEPAR